MSDCGSISKRLIPLSRVVNSALIDSYANAGASKELFFHWASRGLRKLQKERLRTGIRRVFLTVNHNTQTATLPPDFDYELFIGIIDKCGKVGMPLNNKLTNVESIDEIPCDNVCDKCKQSKSICEDLEVSEVTETITINAVNYLKTTVKKLYPNGDYYLETTIPYYNVVTAAVEFATTKEFIVALDLKSCGCLETTEANIKKIQSCSPDVYNCYYSPCERSCDNSLGGYKVFEEIGVIQLDYNFKYDKLYVEYVGYMQKVNGQWAVPEVAFETLVEFTKFKSVQNKKNVPVGERDWYFQNYRRERRNMERVLGRIKLSTILFAIKKIPIFDIDWDDGCATSCCATDYPCVSQITSSTVSDSCETAASSSSNGSTTTVYVGTQHLTPFQLAVIAGNGSGTPVGGAFTYQNSGLIGAVNLNSIIVDNNNETTLAGDFTFSSITGAITRLSAWVAGQTLIIPFAKLV